MSPRSIRRAAERKATKEARKQQNRDRQGADSGADDQVAQASAVASARDDYHHLASSVISSVSEAQIAANRQNAQLSAGPTSEPGKKTSSLNAVKTGLTGRTVLLHSDDAEAYRRHIAAYEAEYKPVGLRECELVQSLADTQWRLNRIPGLESAIYALGRTEFEGVVGDEMIELHTHLRYEKQLRNLQLQESRLLRRYQKELAELRTLQKGGADDQLARASARDDDHHLASSASTLASNFQPARDTEPVADDAALLGELKGSVITVVGEKHLGQLNSICAG